jgi:ADP-dependent NAD(P)H-hydrate dehydratase / NAD(P)H-hydrate epimerase
VPRVATTSQIRKLESELIASYSARWGQVLMEIAGAGAAKNAYSMSLEAPGPVYIFCGSGNNGGDGLVVARFLKQWQLPVHVFMVGKSKSAKSNGAPSPTMSSEEGQTNYKLADSLGISLQEVGDASKIDLQGAALIVDALFGTGLDRPLEGIYKDVIERLNESGKPILAIDIPSGVNSDTGQIMGVAVKAARTVTFGYLKTGHLCHPGAALAGSLRLIDIGLPNLPEEAPVVSLTTAEYVRTVLPERKEDSNKGTFGTLITVAGSLGMSGATVLSTESALRVGAGLCILATPKSLVTSLPAREIIYKPLKETDKQSIAPGAIEELEEELKKASALVLGPGMSMHPQTVEFVQEFVGKTLDRLSDLPCVIDADALNAISTNTDCLSSKRHRFVLTPHPKELSRLMKVTTQAIQADRVNMCLKAAKQLGCVVILKGSFSVVADPDGTVFINPTGNSSMAKAGAGDVLSGVVGGLLSQGLTPLRAAVAGAYIHGRAGELASHTLGMAGVLAGDISDFIADGLLSIEHGLGTELENNLHEVGVPDR